jgi:energy-converting hydrogenase Eha subunit B
MVIDPSVLHLFWKVVSEVNYQAMLSLPDRDLSQVLIQKVSDRLCLDPEQAQILGDYTISKLLLIRDLAEQN